MAGLKPIFIWDKRRSHFRLRKSGAILSGNKLAIAPWLGNAALFYLGIGSRSQAGKSGAIFLGNKLAIARFRLGNAALFYLGIGSRSQAGKSGAIFLGNKLAIAGWKIGRYFFGE